MKLESLGNRIRTLRTQKGMTQAELGQVLNVSKVSISGYENNTREPDMRSLIKLADFFNVTTDYLLGRFLQNIKLIHDLNEDIDMLPDNQKQEIIDFIKFKKELYYQRKAKKAPHND